MSIDGNNTNGSIHDINDVDWNDIAARLTVYASRLVRSRMWVGIKGGEMPAGFCVEDLVQEAIYKVFSGERPWNPQTTDLRAHLCGVIRSLVWNLGNRSENGNFRLGDSNEKDGSLNIDDVISISSVAEGQIYFKQFNTLIKEHFKNDVLSCDVIITMMEKGICDPKSISEELNIDIRYVNNTLKKIRRKIREIFSRLDNGDRDE